VLFDAIGFGGDLHVGRHHPRAARLQPPLAFHFDQTDSARPRRSQAIVVTQNRNLDSVSFCHVEHGLAGFSLLFDFGGGDSWLACGWDSSRNLVAETKTRYKIDVRASASFKFQEMHLLARFDVSLIQARSASECIFGVFVMHLLAQHQNLRGELVF